MLSKTRKKKVKDKDRYSIIQEHGFKETCYLCGRKASDIHEVFNGYNRQNSKDYGLCISLCRTCHEKAHSNKELRYKLQQIGKKAFLKNHDIEDFKEVFHRYYE